MVRMENFLSKFIPLTDMNLLKMLGLHHSVTLTQILQETQ